MADADPGLKKAVARGIVHVLVAHLRVRIPVVCIMVGKVNIQGKTLLKVRIIIRKDLAHDLLKFFEEKISAPALFGMRFRIFWKNLFGRSSTTQLYVQ